MEWKLGVHGVYRDQCFPKLGAPFCEVPLISIVVFWGYHAFLSGGCEGQGYGGISNGQCGQKNKQAKLRLIHEPGSRTFSECEMEPQAGSYGDY